MTISNCWVTGYYELGSVLNGTFKKFAPGVVDHPTGRIKCGTESNGGFINITISNCVFEGCQGLSLIHIFKVPGIACLVLPELRKPEVSIRIRYQSRFAGVRMPETAVYEYHFAPCGKYKVRLARKVSPMQTKTIAQSMYCLLYTSRCV